MSTYEFFATCPYCEEEASYPFAEDEMGQNFVDCEYCKKTYAIRIELRPVTKCTYALIPGFELED